MTKSGTNTTNGSTASSSGATGTASPGDTIKWAVNYANNTTANANVNITDPITPGQTYVNGSLVVPPALAPQYSTNGGTSWTAGTPPAGSTGVGATGNLDPANNITSGAFTTSDVTFNTTGGDGYSVQGFGSNIYAVYHHGADTTTVFCATLDNALCAGWTSHASYVSATVGAPLGTGAIQYATAGVNGSFIENGKLYWPVEALTPVNGSYPVGVQCLNLTTQASCGFTQLDTVAIAAPGGLFGQIAGDGIKAANGNYYFIDSNGSLPCFNPATESSCGVTNPGLGAVTVPQMYFAEVGTYGNYVYFTYSTGNNDNYLFMYNTATPIPTLVTAVYMGTAQPYAAASIPSEVLPVLSATGAVIGACSVYHTLYTGCFDLNNVQIPNPYALSQYSFAPGVLGFGSGVAVGTKYYITYGSTSTLCFDFALRVGSGLVPACAGFNGPADLSSYTVRPLENLPGCMADNGDGAQIVIFNALTGGPCASASKTTTIAAPSYCDGQPHSANWGTFSLNGLTGSEYASASVTISGSTGPVAGFTNLTLAPGQTSVDISSIPLSGTTAGLSVTVNLAGVNNATAVNAATFSLTRTGDTYSQVCYQTTVDPVPCATTSTVSDNATAVTTQGATTDGPGGNSSGAVSFTVTPSAAQCPGPVITCASDGYVFNTGYDAATGGVLADNSKDANWQVAGPFAAGTSGSIPPGTASFAAANVGNLVSYPGGWLPPTGGNAQWISQQTIANSTSGQGDWFYRYTFTLDPSVDPSTFSLGMNFMADNAVQHVWVNGVDQNGQTTGLPSSGANNPYTYPGFGDGTQAQTTLNHNWQTGTNTIIVSIASNPAQEGFLAQFRTNSVCPATISLTKALSGARIADSDQFTMQIHTGSATGPVVNSTTSSTTTGTGATVTAGTGTTGTFSGAGGTTYYLTEAPAGGTTLSNYLQTITCTDATGRQSGLPTNQAFNVSLALTPVAGATISCILTNTAGPQWTMEKDASVGGSPSDGTSVSPGETITYTVTATSVRGQIDGVVLTDDLSGVLGNASFVSGSAVLVVGAGSPVPVADPVVPSTTLATAPFTLPAGQVATLQYQVLVNQDAWTKELINTVTGTATTIDPVSCAAGTTPVAPECTTTHRTPAKFLIEKIGESSDSTWVPMSGSTWAVLDDAGGAPGAVNPAYQVEAIPTETGLFQVEGIEPGVYWLEETTAPDGFSLLAEPVHFTVAPDGSVSLGEGSSGGVVTTGDGDGDGIFLVTVRDVPALEMPESGGTGSWPFSLAGSALLLASFVLASGSIRRRRSQPAA